MYSVETTAAGRWPRYLIEGWALGCFMISAGAFTVLMEAPASPVHVAIASDLVRRLLIGAAMGLTAIALIYSPWGRKSGAHMNPAVTLAFLRLGRISRSDALGYSLAQFVGGTAGVYLVAALLGGQFADPPVSFITTVPAQGHETQAFIAETTISALMMWVVLSSASQPRLVRYTGVFAGLLVCLFITFEAPMSGMSINPARSFASALPAHMWNAFWVYLTAPVLGMQIAAWPFVSRRGPMPCPASRILIRLNLENTPYE